MDCRLLLWVHSPYPSLRLLHLVNCKSCFYFLHTCSHYVLCLLIWMESALVCLSFFVLELVMCVFNAALEILWLIYHKCHAGLKYTKRPNLFKIWKGSFFKYVRENRKKATDDINLYKCINKLSKIFSKETSISINAYTDSQNSFVIKLLLFLSLCSAKAQCRF